jgi:hypothetical protein
VSARRQIIAALSEDSLGGIATMEDVAHAEQLVDAYRIETLRDEASNLRRVEREEVPEGALGTKTGLLKAALILDERADLAGQKATASAPTATPAAPAFGPLPDYLHAIGQAGSQYEQALYTAYRKAIAEVARLQAKTAASQPSAGEVIPADTNRRARLLHEMAHGARWKSGDVVRWYQAQGLTGLGVRAARHDLAVLRDSGAITEHNEKGVRFYTLNSQKGSRS